VICRREHHPHIRLPESVIASVSRRCFGRPTQDTKRVLIGLSSPAEIAVIPAPLSHRNTDVTITGESR